MKNASDYADIIVLVLATSDINYGRVAPVDLVSTYFTDPHLLTMQNNSVQCKVYQTLPHLLGVGVGVAVWQ